MRTKLKKTKDFTVAEGHGHPLVNNDCRLSNIKIMKNVKFKIKKKTSKQIQLHFFVCTQFGSIKMPCLERGL